MRGPMVSGVINQLLTTTDWYAKPTVDPCLKPSDAHDIFNSHYFQLLRTYTKQFFLITCE